MVAPEREKPRKGRQRPWTRPMIKEVWELRAAAPWGDSFREAMRMSAPAQKARRRSGEDCRKRSSIPPAGKSFRAASMSKRPVRAVPKVAKAVCFKKENSGNFRFSEISFPAGPKIKQDLEHGSRMKRNQKQSHLRLGGVQSHAFFSHDHVGGAGNRQEFGETLNEGQKRDLKKVHEESPGAG